MNQELNNCSSLTLSPDDERSGSVHILLSNENTSISAILGLLRIYDVTKIDPVKRDKESEHEVSLTFFSRDETRLETIVLSSKFGVKGLASYIRKMTTPRKKLLNN